jgi:hypothetical protein
MNNEHQIFQKENSIILGKVLLWGFGYIELFNRRTG